MIGIKREYRNVLKAIIEYYHYDITYADLLEAGRSDQLYFADSEIRVGGMEFRAIHKNYIDELMAKELEGLYKDDYYCRLEEMPIILQDSIDWNKVALITYANEGYASTFASYDHVALESEDYFIFRTN